MPDFTRLAFHHILLFREQDGFKHLSHNHPTEIRAYVPFIPPQDIATDSEVSAYPKILLHKLLWYPKFRGSDSDGISQLLLVFVKFHFICRFSELADVSPYLLLTMA